jgi:hypothetical protein
VLLVPSGDGERASTPANSEHAPDPAWQLALGIGELSAGGERVAWNWPLFGSLLRHDEANCQSIVRRARLANGIG